LARGVMPSALLASEIDAVRKDRQIAKPESKAIRDEGIGDTAPGACSAILGFDNVTAG
jgi:hypothetical protein